MWDHTQQALHKPSVSTYGDRNCHMGRACHPFWQHIPLSSPPCSTSICLLFHLLESTLGGMLVGVRLQGLHRQQSLSSPTLGPGNLYRLWPALPRGLWLCTLSFQIWKFPLSHVALVTSLILWTKSWVPVSVWFQLTYSVSFKTYKERDSVTGPLHRLLSLLLLIQVLVRLHPSLNLSAHTEPLPRRVFPEHLLQAELPLSPSTLHSQPALVFFTACRPRKGGPALLTESLMNGHVNDALWPRGQSGSYSPRAEASGCRCELTTKETLTSPLFVPNLFQPLFQAILTLSPPCDLPFQPEASQASQDCLLLVHNAAPALRCLPLSLLTLHLPVAQQINCANNPWCSPLIPKNKVMKNVNKYSKNLKDKNKTLGNGFESPFQINRKLF